MLLNSEGAQLSDEERGLAERFAQGETQTAIAAQLGLNRSAVWRRAKAIAAKRTKTP
jgi:DNA-binding NarL/FixJ family response regulator